MPVTRACAALTAACVTVVLALTGAPSAGAADAVACAATAPVLAGSSTGALLSYPLARPSSSTAAFGARSQIGSGWQAYSRVIAGPDGWVYAVKADGLWLYHRSGTTWDVQRRHIAALGAYAASAGRDRITSDERGTIFVLDDAKAIRAYRLNADHTAFAVAGDVVASAVGSRDLLVAAGDGVLYTRRTDGTLWRLRYEATSDRLIAAEKRVGSGWSAFTGGVVSPGGEVLLAIAGDGSLKHYRYREDTGTWPVAGRQIGTGWGSLRSVSAQSNSCRQTTSYVPPAVTVPRDLTAAPTTSVVCGPSGVVDTLAMGTPDRLLWARYNRVTGGHALDQLPMAGALGTPAAAHLADGRLATLVTTGNGRMWGATQVGATFGLAPATDEGGLMATPAAVVESAGDLTYLAVDSRGELWGKSQARSTGELLPWRALGVTGLKKVAPTVASFTDERALVTLVSSDGSLRLAWFDGAVFSGWVSAGGTGLVGRPAVSVYPGGFDAVVAARDADGGIVARRVALDSSGSSTPWVSVPEAASTTSGDPAFAVTGKGTSAIVTRRTSVSTLVAADETDVRSGQWQGWVPVPTTPQGATETDPAVASGYAWSIGNSWFAVSAGPA